MEREERNGRGRGRGGERERERERIILLEAARIWVLTVLGYASITPVPSCLFLLQTSPHSLEQDALHPHGSCLQLVAPACTVPSGTAAP